MLIQPVVNADSNDRFDINHSSARAVRKFSFEGLNRSPIRLFRSVELAQGSAERLSSGKRSSSKRSIGGRQSFFRQKNSRTTPPRPQESLREISSKSSKFAVAYHQKSNSNANSIMTLHYMRNPMYALCLLAAVCVRQHVQNNRYELRALYRRNEPELTKYSF